MLAARGRISLDRSPLQWMDAALSLPRVIAATAILESALLITKDERMQESAAVRTAW